LLRSNRSIQTLLAGQTASKAPRLSATAIPISSDPMYSKLQATFCSLQNACTIGSSVRFSEPDTMVNVLIGLCPQPLRRPDRPAHTINARTTLMRRLGPEYVAAGAPKGSG
jgi:hypothetical protein